MNYTSIEQSKKLLELGLKAEMADACYDVGYGQTKAHIECENFISYFTNDEFPELKDRYIPCWSLGALLELMPKSLEDKANYYEITVYYSKTESEWYLGYVTIDMRRTFKVFHNISLIEAAFNMVVYLLENEYIKTENQK